jgi:hypothetical protein
MADSYAFISPGDLAGDGERVRTLRQGSMADLMADKSYDPDLADSWPRAQVGASQQNVRILNTQSGVYEDASLCPLN